MSEERCELLEAPNKPTLLLRGAAACQRRGTPGTPGPRRQSLSAAGAGGLRSVSWRAP